MTAAMINVAGKQASRLRLKQRLIVRYAGKGPGCGEASVASAIETAVLVSQPLPCQVAGKQASRLRLKPSRMLATRAIALIVAGKQASRLRLKRKVSACSTSILTALRGSKRRVCD